jgi:hypothetical protein
MDKFAQAQHLGDNLTLLGTLRSPKCASALGHHIQCWLANLRLQLSRQNKESSKVKLHAIKRQRYLSVLASCAWSITLRKQSFFI